MTLISDSAPNAAILHAGTDRELVAVKIHRNVDEPFRFIKPSDYDHQTMMLLTRDSLDNEIEQETVRARKRGPRKCDLVTAQALQEWNRV